MQLNQGGLGDQGTWVDPEVGLKLAAWLNPRFEVWVYKMIRILLVEGEVKLKDHIQELEALTDDMANDLILKERAINRMKYDIDELKEMAQWRQENSF